MVEHRISYCHDGFNLHWTKHLPYRILPTDYISTTLLIESNPFFDEEQDLKRFTRFMNGKVFLRVEIIYVDYMDRLHVVLKNRDNG